MVKIESQLKPEERKFTEPPVRLTTQKDIDKARENEQINYLENDAQGVNLYKLKKFTDDELVDHFLGKEVKPSTKGTRKTSAATSVATQTAFDMIPSIFKGKVSEFELSKISEKIRRDPRIKFSAGVKKAITNLFLEAIENKFSIDELDKDNCYSFVLLHYKNKNIVNYSNSLKMLNDHDLVFVYQ